ncbi:MAG: hypothetical protein CMI29_07185 [Opitutae bacterium]|nr:hypothetical protein [Opitutae bacterium]
MVEPRTKNFKPSELRCKCDFCKGEVENECDPYALRMLQKIRDEVGPLALTSAYRCARHPEEAEKEQPGQHFKGVAFDIYVPWGVKRMQIVELALKLGAKGFGFANSFLHIDWRVSSEPVSWTYH